MLVETVLNFCVPANGQCEVELLYQLLSDKIFLINLLFLA